MTGKKSVLSTEEENAKFAKMSSARKRVAVAKDVLKWLAAGALVAENGTYISPSFSDKMWDEKDDRLELRSLLRRSVENREACWACAKGAMFLCYLDRADKLTVGEAKKGGRTTTSSSVT